MARLPGQRAHIVLIPGFAGFDALGQLEYYAGVTPEFRGWKKRKPSNRDVALHYFDNFPTAAVATRAARLRAYLAKRITRGEILPDDTLALVGHSTGGLDIRRLLCDLAESPGDSYQVDGVEPGNFAVSAKEILRLINRVVFLSVPQFGTNIANWVRSYKVGRDAVVADLRGSVVVSQTALLDRLQDSILSSFATSAKIGLVWAIRDAFSEAEAGAYRDPEHTALAQEAASDVGLWLRHIASDFSVIDDLAAGDAMQDPDSPAHFDWATRDEEEAAWKRFGITTRSYATVGTRPFHVDPGEPAPRWELLNPLSYPECTPREHPTPHTDFVYRWCYRACAGGPFRSAFPGKLPVPVPFAVNGSGKRPIELWDNDGIVNTASMLWPNRKDTLLVEADHMDIVGHYRFVHDPDKQSRRKYQAYNLFKSGSHFHPDGFARVWNDIFDFCV